MIAKLTRRGLLGGTGMIAVPLALGPLMTPRAARAAASLTAAEWGGDVV